MIFNSKLLRGKASCRQSDKKTKSTVRKLDVTAMKLIGRSTSEPRQSLTTIQKTRGS